MSTLLKKYKTCMKHIFLSRFHVAQEELIPVLSVIPAMKNASILLTGTYGTGKTTFVEALAEHFFVDNKKPNIARIRCHQDLSDIEVLYTIKFSEPDAPVIARDLLKKRIRYFNELPRSNPRLQNAFLSLFSEQQISYRDQYFDVTDGINICDQNPDDIGQDGIVRALLDRFDMQIILPDSAYPSLQNSVDDAPALSSIEMETIWSEVNAVKIGDEIRDYGMMLNRYFSACIAPRSIITGGHELPCDECSYKAEVCRVLHSVPGMRGRLSMFHMARALAWYRGHTSVTADDLETALPYCYAHRLDFSSEIENCAYNSQNYLQTTFIEGHLAAKRQHWLDAIKAKHNGDLKTIFNIASKTDDLVVAWLHDIAAKQFPLRQVS